jgi:starch-binding outer membrane protein, SusD/RagB family
MKKLFILFFISATLATLSGCKKDFLTRLPEDSITFENFPETETGVASVTSILYNKPWFEFHDKLLWAVGEIGGGNVRTFDSYWAPYLTLSVTAEDRAISVGWRSLFSVISTSNEIIKNIEAKKASGSLQPAILDAGAGEAKFMRAAAYFYLVRLFGDVPLYEDAIPYIESGENLPKHKAADVYKFIERDLLDAESKLPLRSQRALKRRVSKGSAQTLLAKVYLYQKRYADAKAKAQAAIQSNEFGLMGLDFLPAKGYGDLFNLKDAVNDDNRENIFSLNWGFRPTMNEWGIQNTLQAYFALNVCSPNDGWGGGNNPTLDLIEKYVPGDKRKQGTMMTENSSYSNLVTKEQPFIYTKADADRSATGANIKKQVIGTSVVNGDDNVAFMCTTMPTYLLRCSELYLIYAEAILGGANGNSISLSSSTADGQALNYFNKVRTRAGLPSKTSITLKDIIDERRLELAIEFDAYFDLTRLQQSEWSAILASQRRGTRVATTGAYTPLVFAVPTKLTFPLPAGELVKNPRLLEASVDYKF